MTEVTDKVERAIARFERVTRQLDERDGPSRDAARRERQRLNAGFGRTLRTGWRRDRIHLARDHRHRVRAADRHVRLPRALVGLRSALPHCSSPAAAARSSRAGATHRPSERRDGRAVRFLSLSRRERALPAPAQAEIDAISRGPPLAQADAWTGRDPRSRSAGRAPPDVDPSSRPDRPLSSHVPPAYRDQGTAKARPSTSAWSKASPRAARRSPKCRNSSHEPTWPHWRRRAASSSRATARMRSSLPRRKDPTTARSINKAALSDHLRMSQTFDLVPTKTQAQQNFVGVFAEDRRRQVGIGTVTIEPHRRTDLGNFGDGSNHLPDAAPERRRAPG